VDVPVSVYVHIHDGEVLVLVVGVVDESKGVSLATQSSPVAG